MREVKKECISLLSACQAAPYADCFEQLFADQTKHFISVAFPIPLIYHAEMIDIYNDSVHFRIFMIVIILLRIAVEKFFIVKSCQQVFLCRLDNFPVFG